MKRLVFIFFILIAYTSSAQYTIPWATEQPAWVFPIYFEEGTGLKDTIYLGYDPGAQEDLGVDIIFGEGYQVIDTSEFRAYFSSCCVDSAIRADVSGEGYGPGYSIFFSNGVLPLKISWDVNMFYHNALPFPDQSPAPRAQGEITFGGPMSTGTDSSFCLWSEPILVTDTFIIDFNCVREDTVLFIHEDSLVGYPIGITSFFVDRWIGMLDLNVPDHSDRVSLKIYPNPTTGKFQIQSPKAQKVLVYDLLGREVFSGKLVSGKSEIDLSSYPAGVYFVKAGQAVRKLILQ